MMSAGASGGALRDRPARTYVTGIWTRRVRALSYTLMGAACLVALVRFPFLPGTIPVHFNALGEADGWGSRWLVFVLMAVAIATTAGVAWLSHHPRLYNYPAAITEHNAQKLYRAGEQMMVGLTLSMALTFSGILLGMVLPVNLIVLVVPGLIVMLGSIVWGIARVPSRA